MALIEVPQPTGYPPLEEKNPFEEPPPVVVTPSDPWPRPYYLENGLRRVAPYHYTYNTYCKERWRGRELLDIFSSEFRDRPLEYYVSSDLRYTIQYADKHRKMP
jgi:tRNA pseudouridine synthase 9